MSEDRIGIIIIGHGALSKCFLDAARMIYQHPIDNIATVSSDNKLSHAQVVARCNQAVQRLGKTNASLIILHDTFGSTAARVTCKEGAINGTRIICAFGLNLSMLLDCVNYRDSCSLEELASKICDAGREAIFTKDPAADDAD